MRKRDDPAPVSNDELDTLFPAFLGHERVLLAVSGGRDSIALLVLAQEWRRQRGGNRRPELHAVTVDHGLRPASRTEAIHVSQLCNVLGVPHTTHAIRSVAPTSGLQEWARTARYDALIAEASMARCTALATGHQAEDQAETLLMRLARGSGLDGLTAMAPQSARGPITLLRPLLGLSRARLTAVLEQRKISWVDDPSNHDPRFERTAYALNTVALADLGLSPAAIGLSARRLSDVRDVMDWSVARFLDTVPECGEALARAAYGVLPRPQFDDLPVEMRRRTLAYVMSRVSGQVSQPRLDRLEALTDRIAGIRDWPQSDARSQTLAGCLVHVTTGQIAVFREPGRDGFPVLPLEPGQSGCWDNRFHVSVPRLTGCRVDVRAFSVPPAGAVCDLPDNYRNNLPAAARAAIPAFWKGTGLLAVPQLGFAAAEFRFDTQSPYWAPAEQDPGKAGPGAVSDTTFWAYPHRNGSRGLNFVPNRTIKEE